MHDGHRVSGIGLGAGLIAEDPEGEHRGADGPVLGDDCCDQWGVRGQVVGIEFAGVNRLRAGLVQRLYLLIELIGSACGQHHRRAWSEPSRQLNADLAAAAQN
nr:hypothetical protein MFLOJ_02630 [Mycobacterium florentinum]